MERPAAAGYREQARELADRLLDANYDPYTRAGMGTHDFSPSALALELLAADSPPMTIWSQVRPTVD